MKRLLSTLKQVDLLLLVLFTIILALINTFFTNVAYDLAGRFFVWLASIMWPSADLGNSEGAPAGPLILAFVALLAVFAVVLAWGLRRAGKLLGSKANMVPAEIQAPARFLVLGFSPTTESVREAALAEVRAHGHALVAQNTEDYERSCRELGITPLRQPWQQSLRAIKPHVAALERIFVLAPDPDETKIGEFIGYVEACFPTLAGKTRFVTRAGESRPFLTYSSGMHRPNVLYEDYSYVHDGIKRALNMVDAINPENQRAKTDVCVDATAGNKTFSIGAAIATLNSHCVFSYVGNDGAPRFYDAHVEIGGDV